LNRIGSTKQRNENCATRGNEVQAGGIEKKEKRRKVLKASWQKADKDRKKSKKLKPGSGHSTKPLGGHLGWDKHFNSWEVVGPEEVDHLGPVKGEGTKKNKRARKI